MAATAREQTAASLDGSDDSDWDPLVMISAEEQKERDEKEEATAQVLVNANEVLHALDALLESTTGCSDDNGDGNNKGATTRQEETSVERLLTSDESSRLKIRQKLRAAMTKLQQSLNLNMQLAAQLQQRVVEPLAQQLSVTAMTRKVVTGSKTTRVRDYVVLPRVVRVLDKYTFTFGVLGLLLTEFVVLQFPSLFQYYFIIIMLPLLALRVVLFNRTKQQYFLLDYCYWINALGFALILAPHILPVEAMEKLQVVLEIVWQIFFVSSNGPLFFAMIAWNNSLVFHSVDKVTSTYVHLFPGILSFCERWRSQHALLNNPQLHLTTPSRHLGYPMLFYATWQVVYLVQTEWLHRQTLDADPDLSTSLRYLTAAEKMDIHQVTLKFCRSCGIMRPDETFSSSSNRHHSTTAPTLKVKFIFVTLQALLTLITFAPVRLLYDFQVIHCAVVLAVLTFSVYNGARYYIQVFSRIYEKRYNDVGATPVVDEEFVDTSAIMTEHIKKE